MQDTFGSQMVAAMTATSTVHVVPDRVVSECNEAAIALLVAAGYTPDTPDTQGALVEDDAQSLLVHAFIRCPDILDLLSDLGIY